MNLIQYARLALKGLNLMQYARLVLKGLNLIQYSRLVLKGLNLIQYTRLVLKGLNLIQYTRLVLKGLNLIQYARLGRSTGQQACTWAAGHVPKDYIVVDHTTTGCIPIDHTACTKMVTVANNVGMGWGWVRYD